MKTQLTFILSFFTTVLFAQTYISNVNILDVENQKIIKNQTVTISEDLITNIQPSSKCKIPANAKVIDGTNKYLIPGLTDSHVHFFQSGGLYTRPDAFDFSAFMPYEKEINWVHGNMEDALRRYLQNGITNVIDLGSTYNFLKQRDTISSKWFSPSISMAGPIISLWHIPTFENRPDDNPFLFVSNVEEAKEIVKQQLLFNPDLIKIYYVFKTDSSGLEACAKKYLPIIKAIIDEAHKNNLKVAIHTKQRITAQLSVENGCDYLVHSIEDEILSDDFIKLMKQKNVTLCPTLEVENSYPNTFAQKLDFSFIDLKNANPFQIGTLLDVKHLSDTLRIKKLKRNFTSVKLINYCKKADSIEHINLKRLSDADINITSGTDAGNIGLMHASSYLAELKLMKECGLSNWQIIQSSTINGAKVLNKESIFGSIAIGKKANLVLLKANPIDDIDNITKIDLVINRGLVINPDTLILETPESLVQRQLNGYNYRNIEAFLEPYSDDVEVYYYPDSLLYRGKEIMKNKYSELFKNTPYLHCELKNRIIQGNIIIDKEQVQFSDGIKEAVAIYHIENNKIIKVYFIK